jgi:hypothetical protein
MRQFSKVPAYAPAPRVPVKLPASTQLETTTELVDWHQTPAPQDAHVAPFANVKPDKLAPLVRCTHRIAPVLLVMGVG